MTEQTEQWESLRSYARHRSVQLRAVQKAIESGRVKADAVRRNTRGRLTAIERNRADTQWAQNTDPVEAAKSGKVIEPPADTRGQMPLVPVGDDRREGGDPAPQATDRDPHGFYEARARTEHFKAKQAELDYLQAIDKLVSAAAVEKEMAEIFGTLKNNVLRVADRKAQILAAESDPVRVHRLLTVEFEAVFNELSRRFESEAAGGPEEPAAALS
jgi:hypothetical protein